MTEDTMKDSIIKNRMMDENFKPLKMIDDWKMIGGHLYSPGMQVANGIHPSDVICKTGLELFMRVSNGDPVCLKPSSVERLMSLGFADCF